MCTNFDTHCYYITSVIVTDNLPTYISELDATEAPYILAEDQEGKRKTLALFSPSKLPLWHNWKQTFQDHFTQREGLLYNIQPRLFPHPRSPPSRMNNGFTTVPQKGSCKQEDTNPLSGLELLTVQPSDDLMTGSGDLIPHTIA